MDNRRTILEDTLNKRKLAICDGEEQYLYRLRDYLSERDAFPFDISIYSEVDALERAVTKGNIDVLLIADSSYESSMDTDGMLIILLDCGRANIDKPCIWKYQSAEIIRRKITQFFAEYKSDDEDIRPGGYSTINRSRETTIVGFHTPVGTCLQSYFTILFGLMLGKKFPVLYLNLQCFSGLKDFLGSGEDKDITDLVYFLRSNSETFSYNLESMVCRHNGLDYIAPARSFVDMESVEEDDWINLIRALKKCSTYEYIILDISMGIHGILNILKECQRVYTLTHNDNRAINQIEDYERTIKDVGYEDIIERTRKIEISEQMCSPIDIHELEAGGLALPVKNLLKEEYDYGV